MKKTLIAVAALAFAGVASAQVTLAGKMNMGIAKTGSGQAALTNGADGSSSRLIFRGTEDLGGGLKANFHYEAGFNVDTGALDNSSNQLFQRQAWGGVSGGFGEVRLGRQYTVGFFGSIGNMPATYVDPQLAVGFGFNGMGSRNSDQIVYMTPAMGGLKASISTQLTGDTATAANEVGVSYSAGPISFNLTSSKVKGTSGSHLGLNGAYNMGAAKLVIGMVDKAGTGTGKGNFIRVTAPMGAATLFAGWANNSDTDRSAQDVGVFYSLSKRTRIYAMHGSGDGAITDRTSVGIDHNF